LVNAVVNVVDNSVVANHDGRVPPAGVQKRTERTTRLDRAKILSAALAVADRNGLDGMTMRMVGAELEADPTAIYRHFPSKDDLISAMADQLFSEVGRGPFVGDWRVRLVQGLRSVRAVYRSHSAIIEVLVNRPEDSASLVALNELTIGCLREAGLDNRQVGQFHQLLVSFVVGTGVHEASWGDPSDDARAAGRRAYAALDPAHFPNGVAGDGDLFPPEDEVFDFAVELLVDAVAATGRRNRRARKNAGSPPATPEENRR
jgi:AcrR family transcriptional regulator